MHRKYYILYLLLLVCAFTACTPRSIREAQSIVAQADSLWHEGKQYGVDEGDSATLAQAYETFGKYSVFSIQFSDTYAHACYHYGKLLRAKENPVEAMQVFINATYSHTRDYHILGRVYSNMGDICHLAAEFQLSYDMFEKSADMFLKNGDTLSYYYAMNDMAYELAEQGKKDSCFLITNEIINQCMKDDVLKSHCCISQAQACLKMHEYDSVIYYVYLNYKMREESSVALLLAQSFSYMGKRDSAICYAELVLQEDPTLEELNNALYILTNDDMSKDRDAIRETAAKRADTQKLLEIRQGKLSQAVQLLEQDLERKPDRRWVYAIIITLVAVGVIIFAYVQYKHKKRKLLSQQIEGLTILNKEAEAQHANLTKEIDTLSQLHNAHHKEIVADIEQFCALIRCNQDLREHLHWNNFAEMCILSDRYLYNIVTQLQPYNLSQKELRLCILVLLKVPTNQMVDMIPYAQSGLGKFKYTTAIKLGTTTSNLRPFILNLLG